MKAILISIRPQWVEKILNGIKKDEIRKGTAIGKAINKLIEEQGVAPMLIYCTKNKKQTLYLDLERDLSGDYCFVDEYKPFNKLNDGQILNGKVAARFNATAEEIECLGWDFSYDYHLYGTKELSPRELMLNSKVGYYALEDYLKGGNGTDIHIAKLEIFDKPKELSEFKRCTEKTCIYGKCHKYMHCLKPLTKAPQSWCYVEVDL